MTKVRNLWKTLNCVEHITVFLRADSMLNGTLAVMRPFNKILAVLLGVAIASPSHAYLDPGTRSVILKSLLAGIAEDLEQNSRTQNESSSLLSCHKVAER